MKISISLIVFRGTPWSMERKGGEKSLLTDGSDERRNEWNVERIRE
jgi:hypothetical protein